MSDSFEKMLRTLSFLAAIVCQSKAALPPHPRLLMTPASIADMKNWIANNSEAGQYFANTILQGEWILSRKPDGPSGPNGTPDAREILQQIYATGVLYKVTGNTTWAERGIAGWSLLQPCHLT